jgi:hypothetical protein
MAFDRSKESKLATIARRKARTGKRAVQFSAMARDEERQPRKTTRKGG